MPWRTLLVRTWAEPTMHRVDLCTARPACAVPVHTQRCPDPLMSVLQSAVDAALCAAARLACQLAMLRNLWLMPADPQFVRPVLCGYNATSPQPMRVVIYDVDKVGGDGWARRLLVRHWVRLARNSRSKLA